jgi:hypothetical protein
MHADTVSMTIYSGLLLRDLYRVASRVIRSTCMGTVDSDSTQCSALCIHRRMVVRHISTTAACGIRAASAVAQVCTVSACSHLVLLTLLCVMHVHTCMQALARLV